MPVTLHLIVQYLTFSPSLVFLPLSVSALIKQVNKSIDGTADDEEEGVLTEEAIRAGLELLKVQTVSWHSLQLIKKKKHL